MGEIVILDARNVDGFLDAPDVGVIGLTFGYRVTRTVEKAATHFPDTRFALYDMQRGAPEVRVFFHWTGTEQLLLVRHRIILVEADTNLAPDTLATALTEASAIDPADAARRANSWLGDPPADHDAFAQGLAGRYARTDLVDFSMHFSSCGACEDRHEAGGFQGTSSDITTGTWRRVDTHIIELRWRHNEQDTEVGWSRDRSEQAVDSTERVIVGWSDGRVAEVRKTVGTLPSLVPPRDRYVRS